MNGKAKVGPSKVSLNDCCTAPGQTGVGLYQYKVHLFGNAGSPDSAMFAVKAHAMTQLERYPEAAKVILDHTIVDNGLIGARDLDEGRRMVVSISEMMSEIGMTVHKWASNEPRVLPPGTSQRNLVELNSPYLEGLYPEGKALGIVWNTLHDQMSFAPLKPITSET